MTVIEHLVAVLALALLCGGWVLVQAWVARLDPEQPGVEGSRCGRTGGVCSGECGGEACEGEVGPEDEDRHGGQLVHFPRG